MIGGVISRNGVLIVEDQFIVAEELAQVLRDAGYDLTGIAGTGEDAVDLALSGSPDLVLMDIQLRGAMDGIEAAQAIKKLRDPAIVYLTAHSGKDLFERAKRTEPEGYLYKPVSAMELTRTVEIALYKHQMEKRVKESEQRYRVLVEDSFDGILVHKGEAIAFANKRLHRMLGYDDGELVGKEFWQVCHPDFRDMVKDREIARMYGEHIERHYEIKLQSKDGKILDGEIRAKRVVLEGEPALQIWVRDITAFNKAKEGLDRERQRFQILVEQAPFGLVIVSEDGAFEYVNPKFVNMFGYNPREIPNGQTWFRKAYPDAGYRHLVATTWKGDAQGANIGEQRPRVFSVTCADGTQREILFRPVQLQSRQHIVTCEDITERKQAEEKLRQSEEEFRRIIENLQDPFYRADLNGVFTFLSPASERVAGYRPEEGVGRKIEEFYFVPEERQEFLGLMQRDGFVNDFIARLKHKDGSIVWVSTSARLYTDKDGNPAGVEGIARDISGRMQTEEALRQSEEKYRLIFEYSPLGFFHFDKSGTITACNDNFVRTIGSSRRALVGLNIFNSLEDGKMKNAVKEALLGRIGHYEDYYRSVTAGKVSPVKCEFGPIFDLHGNVAGGIGIVEDITTRKKAEEDLVKSEERYRKILETIADGYHEVDLRGNLTLVNDSLCELMGYPREKLMGLNYRLLVEKSDIDRVFTAYNHVYRTGMPNSSFAYDIVRGDGSKRTVSGSISLLRESTGKPAGFCGIFRDITETRRLEERLREAAKMEAIGRLAGSIAHDFNNLLTAIIGYATILKIDLARRGLDSNKLAQIQKCGERAADLTRQLLAYSRRQVLEMKVVDLNALITGMEGLLRRLIAESIQFHTVLDPQLSRVKADAAQLTQIVMNLAVNARDAMPNGGTLTIETRNVVIDDFCAGTARCDVPIGKYVMLSVGDTGEGMDAETRSRVFDPFFSTKDANSGTGLGLSTVYGIVSQHDGHITIYSELGRGTVFKVYFHSSEEHVTETVETPWEKGARGGNETILLVEDEEAVRGLTAEALRSFGYLILEAATPEAAIDLAEDPSRKIDLLLTDVVMPQMDGRSLFNIIKETRNEIKALFMSGYTEDFIVRHGVLDPEVSFISKPFTIDGLAQKVREVLISDRNSSEP